MRGVIFLTCLTLAAQDRPGSRGLNWYSLEKEAALGEALAKDVRDHSTIIDNPAVQQYLQKIGGRLAAQTPEAAFPYRFTVISNDDGAPLHEPFAPAGGYIFVPAPLFLAAHDEDEFAGMLAHAMAHIALRHATRAATRAQVAQQASIPLIFAGVWNGQSTLMPIAMQKVWRGYELDADALAVRMLIGAGFNPAGLQRYVSRQQRDDSRFSSLPPLADRIAAIDAALGAPVPDSPNQDFLRMCELLRNH